MSPNVRIWGKADISRTWRNFGVHAVDVSEIEKALQTIKGYSERVSKLRDDVIATIQTL
jgi:hypothetical protein